MTVPIWLALAWVVLAPAIALVVARCIALGNPAPTPAPDLLADVPVDCLGQDEIDARFRRIVGTRSTFQGRF